MTDALAWSGPSSGNLAPMLSSDTASELRRIRREIRRTREQAREQARDLDRRETEVVRRARREGATQQEIADVLRVTREMVHKIENRDLTDNDEGDI